MKAKRNLIPAVQVLAWLQTNHPELHAASELDRSWVWIAADPQDATTIESLKAFGFSRARRGHPLKSGKVGFYAHSGTQPIPFTSRPRRFGSRGGETGSPSNIIDARDEINALLNQARQLKARGAL